MKTQIEDSGNKRILKLHGELFIQDAGNLKRMLDESINTFDILILDVQGVTGIDISCLQLFLAAQLTSMKKNKVLEFGHNVPEQCVRQAEMLGYRGYSGTHPGLNGWHFGLEG